MKAKSQSSVLETQEHQLVDTYRIKIVLPVRQGEREGTSERLWSEISFREELKLGMSRPLVEHGNPRNPNLKGR
jgi:hypothetical protein